MAQHGVLPPKVFVAYFTAKCSFVMMLQIVLLLVTHFLEYFTADFALKFLELGSIINLVTMIEIIRPNSYIFRRIKGTNGSLFYITEG